MDYNLLYNYQKRDWFIELLFIIQKKLNVIKNQNIYRSYLSILLLFRIKYVLIIISLYLHVHRSVELPPENVKFN